MLTSINYIWPERQNNRFSIRDYPHERDNGWQDNFLEVLESLQGLIQEGKIRHFGISNESPWGAMRFLQLAEEHNLLEKCQYSKPI